MNVLSSLSQKNGEWYYISSMANMGMGNNVKALEHIREAVRLEPGNTQYRMLLNRMEAGMKPSRDLSEGCLQAVGICA